ncbi:MAG: HipA domain-containing protein [Planctomycetota bacterium]
MSRCWSCGEPIAAAVRYHEHCLEQLFGVGQLPDIDIDTARLHTLALAMVGRASISGVQKKLSLRLDDKRCTLQIAVDGAQFVFKPQAGTFPHLPENEWLTQRLAALVGIDVPPCALLALRDGTLAYVVRRFDRADDRKLAMEDFCQLAELAPGAKYSASAEQCGKLVRRYASEPLIELLRLYRQFVFAWWVGNGDMHLKNLALLRHADGRWRLSPAYDQLNTRLVLPDDQQALPVCGKRDNLKTETLRELAERFGIGSKAAERVLREFRDALPTALERVEDAPLPAEMRVVYAATLRQRSPA